MTQHLFNSLIFWCQFGSLGGLPIWRAFFKAQHALLLGLMYLKAFQQNSMLNC